MILKVADRFGLLECLPKQGSYIQMQIAKRLREVLDLSVKEIQELELVVSTVAEGTSVRWNETKDVGNEFEFSRIEVDELTRQLKRLDAEQKLAPNQVRLFETFCVGASK